MAEDGSVRRRVIRLLILTILVVLSIPATCYSADISPEKDLQTRLIKSKTILQKAEQKLDAGVSAKEEIERLKAISEDIKASHHLLSEKFRDRSGRTRGMKAHERHLLMQEGYQKALARYLGLMEALQPGAPDIPQQIQAIKDLLDTILPRPKRPIHGSLPYRNINYPSKEPPLLNFEWV